MFILQSNRLRVEVASPGEAPNQTYRFDRSGFITEVVLDGIHRFCASEPRNLGHPCSGGRGICNEYIFPVSDLAAVGEYFPKPGVGLFLKEKDEPYHFFKKYQIQPFSVTAEQQGEDTIVFITEPLVCMGYALRQKKTVSINDNRLSIHILLENIGDHAFEAEEYCHNFLTVNSMGLGPNYFLNVPSLSDKGTDFIVGCLKGNGHGFSFSEYSAKPVFHTMEGGEFTRDEIFKWRMGNTSEKAFVDVAENIRLSRAALWATDHLIALESFHSISLHPGQTDSWTREWTFDTLD